MGDPIDGEQAEMRQTLPPRLKQAAAVGNAKEAFERAKARQDEADPDDVSSEDKDGNSRGPSQSTLLVQIGRTCEIFRDQRGDGYARVCVNDHTEIWQLRSKAFRQWLARKFYEQEERTPGGQAVSDALNVLEGDAHFDGLEHRLWVRVAPDPIGKGTLWLDLGDPLWRAVQITASGWRVVTDPPILFRRYSLTDAHPEPERGGNLDELRSFLNVKDNHAWVQLVAWLAASLLPNIAHPILVVHGEQGSAKSCMLRFVSRLLDPSRAPLRTEPRDVGEWVLTADHVWCVSLDNVSRLPPWLSDALCRAVTGDAFTKRELHTNSDDIIYEFRRVVALTGIEVVATREDLLDRSILLGLEPIPPTARRSEMEVIAKFEAALPRLLGALLDLVSGVLRELPHIQLPERQRMADFCEVGAAVERVLCWPAGTFSQAYAANVATQHEEALEANPIASALIAFMDSRAEWQGTATELLDQLGASLADGKPKPAGWPKNARALISMLKRVAPNLRAVGIWFWQDRSGKQRSVYLSKRPPDKGDICASSASPASQQGQRQAEPVTQTHSGVTQSSSGMTQNLDTMAWPGVHNDAGDADDAQNLEEEEREWEAARYEP